MLIPVVVQPSALVRPKPQVEQQASSVEPSEIPVKRRETKEENKSTTPKPVNKMDYVGKGVARSLFDSVFRGVIRYFESFFDSQLLRVLYRLGTETLRKSSEIAFLNVLDKKKSFSLNDFVNGTKRALEHIPATAIIEPSFFEGSIPRVLAGLGNMAIRFASRYGLYKISSNSTSRETLGEKNLLDEFAGRSLARVIPVNFDNPVGGIGMRILEQLTIDLNLHVFKPLSRLFPGFADLFNRHT